jgi:hypothetical protein
MRRTRKQKSLHKDSELRQMAIVKLAINPEGYFDFLGDIREEISEQQMIMLLNLQETYRNTLHTHKGEVWDHCLE